MKNKILFQTLKGVSHSGQILFLAFPWSSVRWQRPWNMISYRQPNFLDGFVKNLDLLIADLFYLLHWPHPISPLEGVLSQSTPQDPPLLLRLLLPHPLHQLVRFLPAQKQIKSVEKKKSCDLARSSLSSWTCCGWSSSRCWCRPTIEACGSPQYSH